MDDQCKKLKSKMDKVLQSCANQHLVSKEVYTEKTSKTEIRPLGYSISKVFKCSKCKSVFENERQLRGHTCTNKIKEIGKNVAWNYSGKNSGNNSKIQIETKYRKSDETTSKDDMENKIGPKHLHMLCKQIFQSESELGKHFCQCGLPNSNDNGKKNKNFCSPD